MNVLPQCIVQSTVVLWTMYQLVILAGVMCSGVIQLSSATSSGRPEFFAVSGEMATLPCNISTPLADDAASLILWYKEDVANPIYTLDIRKVALQKARHFPSPDMEGRAYFDTSVHPPLLKIYPIRKADRGDYKCRVDLRRSRTFIHYIRLTIIVPPKVVITDEYGQTMRDVIGPYDEGSSLELFCEASDGEPQPSLTWWRGSVLIDDTYNITPQHVVRNEMLLPDLQRTDLLTEFSCQASNTNLTKPKIEIILLDMNLRPLEVKVLPPRRPLSVGWVAQVSCEARGARPQAAISWWREGRQMMGATETVLEEGNLTVSTYSFKPKLEDQGTTLMCEATHPTLEGDPVQDVVTLDIHYAPQLMLTLGTSNQHSSIKEGTDVYFDCNIKSNPVPEEVTWYVDGVQLATNTTRGILVEKQSLILQKVGREDRGMYHCQAINSEGEGRSDSVRLDVQYAPVCRFPVAALYSVVQGESINITCDVEADPSPGAFQWTLNNTLQGTVDLKRRHPIDGNLLHYVPRYLGDYGTILCWGKKRCWGTKETVHLAHHTRR